jgi:hypothetical protein
VEERDVVGGLEEEVEDVEEVWKWEVVVGW